MLARRLGNEVFALFHAFIFCLLSSLPLPLLQHLHILNRRLADRRPSFIDVQHTLFSLCSLLFCYRPCYLHSSGQVKHRSNNPSYVPQHTIGKHGGINTTIIHSFIRNLLSFTLIVVQPNDRALHKQLARS